MPKGRRSFLSERTTEYCLVPQFTKILNEAFACVVPFFFWSTREGNSTSRQTVVDGVRVCALFPRRPKLDDSGQILMKVNEEVFDAVGELAQNGIPSFAGVPVVSSVVELAQNIECRWFFLTENGQVQGDCEIDCNCAGSPDARLRPVAIDEIALLVEEQSRCTNWQSAINILRVVPTRGLPYEYEFRFGPAYKPVYFISWQRLRE
ncbi:MAG: hypothetical protein WB952_05215 [Terriglobales bacterium]